jgi:hypothetical protein
MSGAIPPLPQYAFMAWCLVKAQGQLYFLVVIPFRHYPHLAVVYAVGRKSVMKWQLSSVLKVDCVQHKDQVQHSKPNLSTNERSFICSKLTPWSRILLEKLVVIRLVKEFFTVYGTRRFITEFTTACIWSTISHIISVRTIIILPSHLRLGLPTGLFRLGFQTKMSHALLISSMRATCPARLLNLTLQW